MSLKEQIKSDIKDAMRAKDVTKRDTLRNLNAAIKQIEVDERKELNDTDVEAILTKYLKQREDALTQFKEANRDDLVAKEEAEIAIVKAYLPEPLSDEELKAMLQDIVTELNATAMKYMCKVMGAIKQKAGSKADGGKVNKFFKEIIS
jgi:uncharacterized protein YqeY